MADVLMERYISLLTPKPIDTTAIDDIIDGCDKVEDSEIIKDLKEIAFKLGSYYEQSGNESYDEGLYSGIELSLNMINLIIDRYSS